MSRSKQIAAVAILALACWPYSSACSLSADACLRMSDCTDGLSCVEGLCLSSAASASTDGADATSSATDATSDTSSATDDASADASAE